MDLDTTSSQPALGGPTAPRGALSDYRLGARSYIDLLATFKLRDNYSFRAGVNNVFDKDPPLSGAANCPNGPCNQNIWPQIYDGLGRYFFVGVTADF